MFNKIKKVFTVFAVLTLIVSSTPLNVLADVVSEPASEQSSSGTPSEVSKTTDSTTISSNTDESSTTSSNTSETNESVGTSINANAPNAYSTDKEAEKPASSEDIKEKNNASGLSSLLIEVANKYNVDAKKVFDLSKRSGDAKYYTTGLSDDEIRVLGLYIFGVYKSSSSDYAKLPNDKGEMIDIPFIYDGSRGHTSSTSFAMNYTLRHRTGATSSFNRIGRQYIDGKPAFCIDPQADFLDNRTYTEFVADNNSDWWKINAYMIFGDDSSDKNHGYLQLMIWEQLGWTVTGVGAPGSLAEYQNYRTAVISTVENFKTKASFHGQTFEVKKGQTITPVDTNGVIQKMGLDPAYPVPAGVQLSGAKNPISITVPANYSGPDTVEFHMLRGAPGGQFDRILRWEMPGAQPGQPVVTSGPVSPTYNDTMFRVHITSDETPPTPPITPPTTPPTEERYTVSFRKVDESGTGLSGARFKIEWQTGSKAGQTEYETSDYSGSVRLVSKTKDTVKVTEVTAPDGYILDSTPKTIVLDNSTNTYRFVNQKEEVPPAPEEGYILIYKQDEQGRALPGARFKIEYISSLTGDVYTTYRTVDQSGFFLVDGEIGQRVRVTEVYTPKGYILDTKPVELTIRKGSEAFSYVFINKKQPKEGTLVLKKEDAETGANAQGKATLDGAVYTLNRKDGTPFKEIQFTGTSATVSGIPFGEYVLKEKTAPKGYSLDTTEYPIVVEESTQEVVINKTVSDTVIKGSIRGYKIGNKSTQDGTPNVKLSGVELTVTSKTTGKKYVTVTQEDGSFEFNNLPYDDYTLTETRGKEGYRLIEPYNFSITSKGQVVTFNPEDKVVENRVKIIKKDKNTGKVIKVEGTQFKIWDKVLDKFVTFNGSEILTTNSEGYVETTTPLLYGVNRYELLEVKAPTGYVLSDELIPFSIASNSNDTVIELTYTNELQKARVLINKTVETATGIANNTSDNGSYTLPTFTQQPGAGFKFKIKAMEDIIAPDGTKYYNRGEFVQANGQDVVLTTNEQGKATSPDLFYVGKYALVEVYAPVGVVLNTADRPFEIKYAGQDVEVATKSLTIENYLQSISIIGTKQEEVLTGWKDGKAIIDLQNASSGQVFALKNSQDIQVGTQTIQANTILGYATVQNGKLNFANIKLPAKETKLYIQEVYANNDYVLDGDKYEFTYTPTNAETVTIKATENPIVNKLAKAQVALYKFDKAQHVGKKSPISNVAFDLYNVLNGQEIKVGTYRTDSNGYITVSDLPTGEYYFKEAAVPEGYVAITDKSAFNVDATTNGKRIDLEVENKRVPIEIGTTATFANGAKEENPYKELTLNDTVALKNLIVGKEYILHAKLIEFGKPDSVIKEFDTRFTASAMNQNVTVTTKVDGTVLRGKKITFMETLLDGEVPTHVWAEHNNPTDEGQSVRVTNPQIGTQATFENGLKEFNPFKENKLVDTIKFNDLIPNRTYTIKSKLVEYGNPQNVINESTFEFTPTTANGEHKIQITVDGTKLRGKKVTFLEYISDKAKPTEELAKHENPKDEGQSVRVTNPQISTQAHFEDGAKEFLPLENVKIVDTVKYTDLTPNRPYTLKAKLIEFGNPSKVIGEATATFTPTAKSGETQVTLTVDGTKLRGKKVTFLEYLYDNEKPNEEQAKHENPKDEGQSVSFTNPEISTTATFENNAKVSNPFKETTIYDTVSYSGLIANRTYNLHAVLVNKETGKVIKETNDSFTPSSPSGSHRLSLVVDGTQLRGTQVVFYEYLTDSSQPKTELAKHEDINDEGQTVRFSNPSISTQATFENGAKVQNPFKENVLVDTIKYENLVPNRPYRLVTKLVDAENPDKVIHESEEVFTPEKESGEYKVTIKVDGTKLRGKTVVFFEYLYDNEKPNEEQAKHENPKDEGQSVRITNPKIGTQAHGYKGEDHKIVQPIKEMTLTDEIKYEDLTINREYRVVTKLIEFGNPDKVIKEVETTFTPKEKDGVYKLHLKLNGLELQGKKVTFMEYIYDAEKPDEELAKHENPKDEEQTVEITKPSIKTLATGAKGQKIIDGVGTQVVHEKAELKGLVVGQKYRVKVQAYIVGTTQPVEGTSAVKEFVADKETMEFNWDFTIKVSQLGGKAISFTEILETENEGGGYEEVHRHNDDHKDKDQTVTIKRIIPKTGLEHSSKVLLSVLILTLLSTLLVVVSVKKRSQKRG